jgi:hypothetical protein
LLCERGLSGAVVGQDVAEPVEAPLPSATAGVDPVLDGAQPFDIESAGPDAPDLLRSDEAGTLQDLQVLDDTCQRHWQWSSQCRDTRGARSQAFDDPAPRWVSERLKDAVDILELVKHVLKYWAGWCESQVET